MKDISKTPLRRISSPAAIAFNRAELDQLLRLYGYFVAAGVWRDYAIDFTKDAAAFSIFRRTSEAPLYRIEKQPKLAKRQGAYAVIAVTGQVLKRGHDLAAVLRVFDKQKFRLLEGGRP